MALLAATTLGDGVGTFRAEVRADGLSDGAYRLVVQSYDGAGGRVSGRPGRKVRPIGSVQRAVTADELRAGVRVSIVEVPRGSTAAIAPVSPFVVAWVEAGEPNLEFDGRMARPRPGDMYGLARRAVRQGAVHISLNRTVAA